MLRYQNILALWAAELWGKFFGLLLSHVSIIFQIFDHKHHYTTLQQWFSALTVQQKNCWPPPPVSDSIDWGCGLIIYISNKLPGTLLLVEGPHFETQGLQKSQQDWKKWLYESLQRKNKERLSSMRKEGTIMIKENPWITGWTKCLRDNI